MSCTQGHLTKSRSVSHTKPSCVHPVMPQEEVLGKSTWRKRKLARGAERRTCGVNRKRKEGGRTNEEQDEKMDKAAQEEV